MTPHSKVYHPSSTICINFIQILFKGQSYQEYTCPAGEEHMQYPVDPNMQITAATHATW
jgi:hypothetical protein